MFFRSKKRDTLDTSPCKLLSPPPASRLSGQGYDELFEFIEHLAGRRLYQYEAVTIKMLIEAGGR